MFLIIGSIVITAVILLVLYFYVFKKFHKVIGFIVLSIISVLLMVTQFMHLIIVGILVFGLGIFLISLAERLKRSNQQTTINRP